MVFPVFLRALRGKEFEAYARQSSQNRKLQRLGRPVQRLAQQLLFQSEDAKEGLAAYVEKRPATFTAK